MLATGVFWSVCVHSQMYIRHKIKVEAKQQYRGEEKEKRLKKRKII